MLFKSIIGIGLTALALTACTKAGSGESGSNSGEVERVPVNFALSVGGVSSGTKADVSKLLELAATPGFRGLSSVRVIPFGSAISGSSESLDWIHSLPAISNDEDMYASQDGYTYHHGLVKGNNAHLYTGADADLPLGTTHVLVYAHPANVLPSSNATEQKIKHFNGSVIENGLAAKTIINTSDVTFSPDPIISGTVPAAAQSIADALNTIASEASFTQSYFYKKNDVWYSSSVAVNWSTVGSQELNDAFKTFTNSGELTTGAGENVKYLIADLYSKLSNYQSENTNTYKHVAGTEEYDAMLAENGTEKLTYAIMYNRLRDILLARIQQLVDTDIISIDTDGSVTFTNSGMNTYPEALGLPAGSAVLRWDGSRFVVVTEALDGVAPIDRYCYMPSLYFYSKSAISTSADTDIYHLYDYKGSSTNWNSVLSQYRSGKKITKRTASVAIDEPLQYGFGLLVVTIKAADETLSDNDNSALTYCTAEGKNFPVTGIIVGGQYRQKYDFSPDATTTEYYMYDKEMPKDSYNKPTVFLTTEKSEEIRTLVFPTVIDSDVYFFLEFRNDSDKSFHGAEGIIMPGSHFYLAGKLEKPSAADKAEGLNSVIMPDHFTTVNCVVSTMENAHISVPELGNPQLALGLQTETGWIHSAASYIVLD